MSIISTNCDPLNAPNIVERRIRGGKIVCVDKPSAVVLYKAHMGGVDRSEINFALTTALAGHFPNGTDTYFGLFSKRSSAMPLLLTKRKSIDREELCVNLGWH